MDQIDKAYAELEAAKNLFNKNHEARMNELRAALKDNEALKPLVEELESIEQKFAELDKSIEEIRQVDKTITKEELQKFKEETSLDEQLASIGDELDKMLEEEDNASWQNSIELPDDNGDWQNEIQLPNDD